MINVQVEKQGSENSISTIRRFTKRVQGSGVLRRARKIRFHSRPKSKFTRKKGALKGIRKRAEREELIKLGRIPDRPLRMRRRR
ncbi:hypothetical protein IID26_02955 [Patescibacteria group bacterium]|nr:hypothetical protein [Patescibacteria group bacterium]